MAFIAAAAFLAGAIGGSAKPGDRLQDIPSVFRRKPATFIVGAVGFGLAAAILRPMVA